MQLVAVDIYSDLFQNLMQECILTVADYFTRWMEAYPIPNQEARTVAKKLTDAFLPT